MTTITRDAGCRLASYIEGRRGEVVGSVVRSAALSQPGSPAATRFANTFLDRLLQELEIGDRDAVDVWIDADADSPDASEHARIVAVASAVIVAGYVRDVGDGDDVMAYLVARSRELERRFRTERSRERTASDAANPAGNFAGTEDVVTGLLAAIEARDGATGEHSRAVGMWSGRLAKIVGLTTEQQAFAALAGTLHDVGKLATPDAVLLKAGPLDPAQWALMRAHSAAGARMLERIAPLRDLAPGVRAHHERIDGRGYPDGLAGNDIPMTARIVAVADSFHAMISKRPYRQALSVPDALEELQAGAGTQWDVAVVEAMLGIVAPTGIQRQLRAIRVAR